MPPKPPANTVSIGLIAAVVVAVYGLIGALGRGSYTPIVMDKAFGLSEYVGRQLGSKAPSAYSRDFTFTDTYDGEPTLVFYARKEGQVVGVSLTSARPMGAGVDSLRIWIDGQPWKVIKVPRDDRSELEVPLDALKGDYLGNDLHELKVVAGAIPAGTRVLVQCLILVKNQ